MNKKLLQAAYSAEEFGRKGHELIDLLTAHLRETLKGETEKVIPWNTPADELRFWKEFLRSGDEKQLLPLVLEHTTRVHHPAFMGHQISPTAPLCALTALVSALLNNGMAVYEMGMAPSAMERVVTDMLCRQFGYSPAAGGFLTSGGTLANLTALLTARKNRAGNKVWEEGSSGRLAIMVSEEAHYCIDRAARIMGLGAEGIIKIPVGPDYRIRTDLLECMHAEAEAKGLEVFALVGSAPSTATGIYDDLDTLAKFARSHGLWYHVDAAHGGAAIFSPVYRHLLNGISGADSLILDGHKMMMMPSVTTALLYRNGSHSHSTFLQKAEYLLQEEAEEDWYNLAKRTFECTKNMMSLHWYALLKTYDTSLFEAFVTTLYDLGSRFATFLEKDTEFELAVKPMSNIVCFRLVGSGIPRVELDALNARIRQEILKEGLYYLVHTRLKGVYYLRTTLMNPFTTDRELLELLETIKKKAAIFAHLP